MAHGFVQQGWQCPCCGRVYSPTTPVCFSCPPKASAAATTATNTGAPVCRQVLHDHGHAAPRTCAVCGLGPCTESKR